MIQPTPGPSSSTARRRLPGGRRGTAPRSRGRAGRRPVRPSSSTGTPSWMRVLRPRGCSAAPTSSCSPPNPSLALADTSLGPSGRISLRTMVRRRRERAVGAAIRPVARSARCARAHRGAARRAAHVSADEAARPAPLRRRRLPEVLARPRRRVLPRRSTTTCRGSGTSGPPISRCRRPVPAARPRSPTRTARSARSGTGSPICTATRAHARELYLHPKIFRMVELIYGEPAIAFQSLYFEYGSQQGAAPRPDVRRHRSARAPARVVGRARRHHARQRPARVRARVAPLAVVRVRARHRSCAARGVTPGTARRVPRLDARADARAGARGRAVHVPARRRVHLARGPAPRRHADREPGTDAAELRRALLHRRAQDVAHRGHARPRRRRLAARARAPPRR